MNRPFSTNDDAIARPSQVPTVEEERQAIRQLSSGKAPGLDAIPAEIFKEGGTALMGKLLTLVQIIWEKESVPQDFKDMSIIHLYKRKGNRQACNNHRGISLLSIAGKIVATVLLNHLNDHLEQGLLPERSWDYRHGVRCQTAPIEMSRTEY